MIRTIAVVSVFLLTAGSIAHAEHGGSSLPSLGFNPSQYQHWHRVDINTSPQEYEETYSHNRKLTLKILKSFAKDTLESIGISEQGFSLMGATIGLAMRGAKLDLNQNKTFTLELEDMDELDRTLYFRVNLDW